MNQQIRIHATGTPSVMQLETVADVGQPGPGQVRLRHEAIGVNFVDTLFRSGAFPAPLPLAMGVEGAGVVVAVGAGVDHVQVGDRTVYFFAPGAYADERLIDARHLVRLPAGMDAETAAATFTKGLTAWMMLFGAHRLQPGETVLVHGAAGGVGSMVARWAAALGATVIATAGSDEKAAQLTSWGIAHVLRSDDPELAAKARAIAGGGVDVVYELVGKATFAQSVLALRDGGHLIHVGNASGSPAVDKAALAARGIRYVQPSTGQYVGERAELERASATLFAAMRDGIFGNERPTRYALRDAAQAHEDMAARRLTGAAILVP
ncbi:quinone oxidoreductase [Pseudoduganella plicata]|uniref:Quinone oxidoreductase n=1 Tax=Pseudoduganella plicata TaxID=321984 RepID=A0A4P7BHZ9_9BURK|nr:quinone oxidoreductase [Pseudoduganella plicata]QBQ37737.1 quinone oxidoreductase [Pseudoduganella plicata]GGY92736.1 quinone oxidoreductase [Pseudoduganella plicata]